MKSAEASASKQNRILRFIRAARTAYIVCAISGAAVVLVGGSLGGLSATLENADVVGCRIMGAGEGILALAASCWALHAILDGYFYVRFEAKSALWAIRGVIGNALTVVLMTGVAVVLGIKAVRDLIGMR